MTDKQLMILLAGIFLVQWGVDDPANLEAQKRAYQLAKTLVTRADALT